MKTAMWLMLVVFLAVPAMGGVGGDVEVYVTGDDGTFSHKADLYMTGGDGKWGWSLFALSVEGWSEIYVGPTYSPRSWVSVSASVGVEDAEDPIRYAGSIWIGKGKFSLLSIHEDGGSGYWYKHIAKYAVHPRVSMGFYSERFFGEGPYLEFVFPKAKIWGAFDYEDHKVHVGLKIPF